MSLQEDGIELQETPETMKSLMLQVLGTMRERLAPDMASDDTETPGGDDQALLRNIDTIQRFLTGGVHILSKEEKLDLEQYIMATRHNLRETLGILTEVRGALITNEQKLSKVKKQKNKLEKEANTDKLTNIPNRAKVKKFLSMEIEKILRDRRNLPVTVLFIDADNFKEINDGGGHDAGDEALKALAKVFKKTIRDTDCVGRWGGDEFIIVLAGADADIAEDVAGRLHDSVEALGIHNEDTELGISVGISVLEEIEESEAEIHEQMAQFGNDQKQRKKYIKQLVRKYRKMLINQSDTALYHVKKVLGRGDTAFYEEGMEKLAA